MEFKDYILRELKSLKENFLYRERKVLDKNIIDFSSNDYLGLKDCAKTKEKLKENLKNLPLGSGSSAFVSGYFDIQKELEEYLAKFKNTEACFVIGSGYLANTGVIPALANENSSIFSDELNHASIIDGIRLSKAKRYIYRHRDLNHLEDLLKKDDKKFKFIITDAVFSMEGDIADIPNLKYLADRYNGMLLIDDAHGTGVLGNGYGTLAHFGINPQENIIQIGTLSKAIGSYGAFVCGSKYIIDYLLNKVRPSIFSTALSPIQNFISLENLKLIDKDKSLIKKLFDNVSFFVDRLKENNLSIKYFGTAILTYILGSEEKVLKVRDYLLKNGVFIQAIRPPTVPKNTARLRITVSAKHSKEDILKAVNLLKECKI